MQANLMDMRANSGRDLDILGPDRFGLTCRCWALGAALAVIVGSNFSLQAFSIGGRYILEPFLLAWLLIASRMIPGFGLTLISALQQRLVLAGAFIVLLGAGIAILRGIELIPIYGDARATLVLIVGFAVWTADCRDNMSRTRLLEGCLIAIPLLDVLRLKLFAADLTLYNSKVTMSFVAPVLLSFLSIKQRNPVIFAYALLSAAYFALNGFFRIYYIAPVAVIACGLVEIWSSAIARDRRRFRFAFALAVLIGAFCSVAVIKWSGVIDHLSADASKRVHSIERTAQFWDALMAGNLELGSDQPRVDSLRVVFGDPASLLMPFGIGWRDAISEIEYRYGASTTIVSSMDSAIFYLGFHYGAFVCYSIIVLLIFWGARAFIRVRGLANKSLFALLTGMVLLDALVESGMLTMVPRAVQMGICFAFLKELSRLDNDRYIYGFSPVGSVQRSSRGIVPPSRLGRARFDSALNMCGGLRPRGN